MGDWKFCKVYWVSTTLRIAGSIFDIVLVKRWNRAIGIPDKASGLTHVKP